KISYRSLPRRISSWFTGNGKTSTSSGYAATPGVATVRVSAVVVAGAGGGVGPACALVAAAGETAEEARLFFPVKNSVSALRKPRGTVPVTGGRDEIPSRKKVVERKGFIRGWSCMS